MLQLESADERTRMYAALALALVGTPEARASLLERLALEKSHLARVGLLQALGVLGVAGDEQPMLAALADMSTPEYQGVVSVALGLHGSMGALDGLFPIARAEERSSVARAAAVDSLGMLLAWRPALELARVGMHANFTLFEPWTLDALLTTL
jgi:HEAT repeat protein